ncbi:MAG: ABC transporter permease [Steroidobacteraceae bacterium]
MTDALRFRHVVYRNYRVWRKLLAASLVGNLLDPLFWLVGLGFGLGSLLPTVGGLPYLEFLGSGMICYGVMYSASFEALWSAFARLKQQRTWEGILHAPMTVTDIVVGEWVWAALKGTLSGVAIFVVMAALGLVRSPTALWALPLMLLTGLAFAGLALVVTAIAKTYDHFVYYFTLFITPMMLVSGVFFPTAQLPPAVQVVAQVLPLSHATGLMRAIVLGQPIGNAGGHLLALALIAVFGLALARALVARRLR